MFCIFFSPLMSGFRDLGSSSTSVGSFTSDFHRSRGKTFKIFQCESLKLSVWFCLWPYFPSYSMLPARPDSKGTCKQKEQCFWKAGHISSGHRRRRQHPTWFDLTCQSRDRISSESLLGIVPSPSATFVFISLEGKRKSFLPSSFFPGAARRALCVSGKPEMSVPSPSLLTHTLHDCGAAPQ